MATATLDEPGVVTKPQFAPRYRVVLHGNGDCPPLFAIYVLQEVFKYDKHAAEILWNEAFEQEVATVCIVPRETAEHLYDQSRSIASTAKLESPISVEPEN